MAWTTPKFWNVEEKLLSAEMNTYVAQNIADLDSRVNAIIPTVVLTQAEYDAITPAPNTLYFIRPAA